NGLAEFEPIRRRFAPEQRAQWNVAIAYLAQHKARIDKERNVYGGHVSAGAVQNAVEQFPLGKKQALEIEWIERSSSTRVGPRFRFAPDLMGRVMLHGHDSDADELTYLRELMALTAEGFEHATNCTMLITDVYVAPHFGF
ncbi:MAG TPA: hypothetical protein VHB78_17710, partial [Vicinamibacterales bacterium]|nr:hypothetical protein [Vicinamibacterales bacterium]